MSKNKSARTAPFLNSNSFLTFFPKIRREKAVCSSIKPGTKSHLFQDPNFLKILFLCLCLFLYCKFLSLQLRGLSREEWEGKERKDSIDGLSPTMMTSSQDHHPNRDHQRTSSAEDTANNNSSNNNQGDNNHDRDLENGRPQSPPQQAMGYPPVMGYPPPGQYPYNAYPGAPSPIQPPFLSQQHPPQSLSMSRLASGILAVVVFFVVLSCVISIGAYMILHPVNPEFHITVLSVTGFSVAPGVSVTGSFEANVTVANPNKKLRVRFHRIESYVYYKNPRGELAWTTEAPFLMEKNTTHMLTVRASADGDVGGDDEEMSGDKEAAAKMEKDWRNGRVEMGLEMGMWVTFRSDGGWWSSRVTMRVQCDGLPVGFAGGNGTSQGTGAWTGNGLPKECSTYR